MMLNVVSYIRKELNSENVSVSGCVNTVVYVIIASKGALYVQMICISE